MKKFTDMIGSGINLNIDAEENREEKKAGSGFALDFEKDEEKIQTTIYMTNTFKKDFDKFIKRFGHVRGGRSEIICKMLQYAMEMIEKENNIK